jgi:hypothetical protein
MDDNLSLIASLQVGETLAVTYTPVYKQKVNSWYTSISRYYYNDDRHKTIAWVKNCIKQALAEKSHISILLLEGLRNLSITYQSDAVIVQQIHEIMNLILQDYTPNREEIIHLLQPINNHNPYLSLNLQLDSSSLLRVLLRYLLRTSFWPLGDFI